jgi:subtilisin
VSRYSTLRAAVSFLAVLAIALVNAGPALADDASASATQSYIVMLNDGVSAPSVATEHARRLGARITYVYDALDGYAAQLNARQLAAIKADPRVDFVGDDRPVKAFAQILPTGIDRIDVDQSSTHAGDGTGTVNGAIAIIDTGIDLANPDLNAAAGTNCINPGSPPQDDMNPIYHGTHVAGTAGAKDNASEVVGAAPGVTLYAVKVLDSSGSGSFAQVDCGINWVTKNAPTLGIKVANMSLGGTGSDDGNCGKTNGDAMHRAICRSTRRADVLYVVAAGNSGQDLAGFTPAAYNEVLTVTAMSDSDGQPGGLGPAPSCRSGEVDDKYATFSNFAATGSRDTNHTIAGPGVCITSTHAGGGTSVLSGTSMASPHVAGTVALCIFNGACAGLTPKQIKSKLLADAKARPASYGFTGDPNHAPVPGRYYGYLAYAGGY